MPDFKQLAEGDKPADPEGYVLVEAIHEPAIENQYAVTGKGLDPDHQPSGDFMHHTLEEARARALQWATAVNVATIYLSNGIAQTET